MPELDDIELLAQYARDNSEAAFAALVTRHVNLVYSTALRNADPLPSGLLALPRRRASKVVG